MIRPKASAPLRSLSRTTDMGTVLGTWYLVAGGRRYTLVLGAQSGKIVEEGGSSRMVADVAWKSGVLRFRAGDQWFWARSAEGVLAGRTAQASGTGTVAPSNPSAWIDHVTGWRQETFDAGLGGRAWDILLDTGERAMLRIDVSSSGALAGRLKVYASVGEESAGEEDEEDLAVDVWDGSTLGFVSHARTTTRAYAATVQGRMISGTFADVSDEAVHTFSGTRADVLGYGLWPRSADARAIWQRATRLRLQTLMMAQEGLPPVTTMRVLGMQDPLNGAPATYTLAEVELLHTLPDPMGGPDLVRRSHGSLALPHGKSPAGGFPALVAINGHGGSAHAVMDPKSLFWYGDGFAQRGWIVLAIDASHRPLADREDLYTDMSDGDDPANGNGAHPAIAFDGLDSDWEEDGERAFDAMRGVDVLRHIPEVSRQQIYVAGLSLGGEVTTYAAALDPRFAGAVAAGYSPDIDVIAYHGNHPCWGWRHASVREYLDPSDLHALIAPRTLIVETGTDDPTFSLFHPPFAADKQVLRRSRAAYGAEADRIIHHLHPGGHIFDAGLLTVPAAIEPATAWSQSWQDDVVTTTSDRSVFDVLEATRYRGRAHR